jgi:hypothetical protein
MEVGALRLGAQLGELLAKSGKGLTGRH